MAPVKYLLASAGLLVSVMADYIAFSEWPASLTAGQPVTLKWIGGSDAPATITLRKGASTDLHDIQVLSSDATNGEFSWTPPADLQNAEDYAFQITQGDEINYTGLLPLSGGSDAPNESALDRTQMDAEDMSNSTSATDTAALPGLTDSVASAVLAATETTGTGTTATTTASSSPSSLGTNAESAAAAVTDTAASTGSAASDATGTPDGSLASEGGSSATSTSGPVSTETATASKMNTPFVGSHNASSTATSSSSVQTGSAGRVSVSLAFLAGAAGLLLSFV